LANFKEHFSQAKRNLDFVVTVNEKVKESWDWQIVSAFYVAVHLVNGHLAYKAGLHYRSHSQVKQALNPNNAESSCILPEDIYTAYQKLEGLSRRARYLCSDDQNNKESIAFLTQEKHFKKAILQLDTILFFFEREYREYGLDFGKPAIFCSLLDEKAPLKIFRLR
jgi:hypothetical protein